MGRFRLAPRRFLAEIGQGAARLGGSCGLM
jgi:hypothetical protein